ncbi:hypothetical protein Mmc1_0088 [Magnetococcus marinus MC-1]|uniref:Uncharacterized protein n=1 Tax=Magnetococcus marinus (strain ATCC BAA-1437 / JCM 17883 / MC-1) TaxID=156889 RepID=A0L3S4_MAGMM|nr:hypothetical protein [Magnetococcus marinus]ABK42617.1 hypothetical protein Mmc1_0088 [Magnetococcus marinus MC-1]
MVERLPADPFERIQAGLKISLERPMLSNELTMPGVKREDPDSVRPLEEEWQAARQRIAQFNAQRNWMGVLNTLLEMSNNDRHPEAYLARLQAAWLVVKLPQAPVSHVVIVLYNLLASLESGHPAAGPLAALANLMALHRTPDHPERELAQMQAQQMWDMAAHNLGIEPGSHFESWMERNGLNDPNSFVPRIMGMLEKMENRPWWIDKEAIQEDMMQQA